MTSYSGKPVTLNMSAEDAYERLNNLGAFQERINALPDEIKSKIGDISFTEDTISFNGTPMGSLTLRISERVPGQRVAFNAEGAPVPIIMAVNIAPAGEGMSTAVTSIDVELPAMLKPMVGPRLQEAADKMGDMMKNLVTLK